MKKTISILLICALLLGGMAAQFSALAADLDTTALEAYIAIFSGYAELEYTGASWSLAAAAYANALTVLDGAKAAPPEVDQVEINAAATALGNAIFITLVPRDGITALRAALNRYGVSMLNQNTFTEESWNLVILAYNAAMLAYQNTNVTDVSAEAGALNTALNNLVPIVLKLGQSDDVILRKGAVNAKTISLSLDTNATNLVYEASNAHATVNSSGGPVTGVSYGDVVVTVTDTRSLLTVTVTFHVTDADDLKEAIEIFEGLDENQYTKASYDAAYLGAYKTATDVFDDLESPQVDINAAEKALREVVLVPIDLTFDDGSVLRTIHYRKNIPYEFKLDTNALAADLIDDSSDDTKAEVTALSTEDCAVTGYVGTGWQPALNPVIITITDDRSKKLVTIEFNVTDGDDLETALEDIANENLDKNDYTKESWDEFQDALDHAKDVLDNPESTQQEIDEALDSLLDAIANLEDRVIEPLNLYSITVPLKKGGYTYQYDIDPHWIDIGQVVFFSANPNVTVSEYGLITSVSPGLAVVTVLDTWNNVFANVVINVTN